MLRLILLVIDEGVNGDVVDGETEERRDKREDERFKREEE